jgi:UDP-glucose 4-epimerase
LRDGGKSLTCNCGYGRGRTVLEVIEVVKKVSKVDFEVRIVGRRAGDPAALVAGADRIRSALSWVPRHDDLEQIVQQAFDWEHKLRNRLTV